MSSRKDQILDYIYKNTYGSFEKESDFCTLEIAESLNLQRTYVSSILNQLVVDGVLTKKDGRPVSYYLKNTQGDTLMEEYFSKIVGYGNTLKNVFREIEAAVKYPSDHTKILFCGEYGTGKTGIAKAMFGFAKAQGIIKDDHPLIIDCSSLLQLAQDYEKLVEYVESEYENVNPECILIHNVEKIDKLIVKDFYRYIETRFSKTRISLFIISATLDQDVMIDYYVDFRIDFPTLNKYQDFERMDLVINAFNCESHKLKNKIHVDPVLMKCLIFYDVKYNIAQLENDIKKGCARAYAHFKPGSEYVYVYLNDFSSQVRSGIFKYRENYIGVSEIISNENNYVFAGDHYYQTNYHIGDISNNNTLVDIVNCHIDELKKQGATNQEIENYVTENSLFYVEKYIKLKLSKFNSLIEVSRVADAKMIQSVARFLERIEVELHRTYSKNIFYVLCMYLFDIVHQTSSIHVKMEKMVNNLAAFSQAELKLIREYALEIKEWFGYDMNDIDIAFMGIIVLNIERISSKTKAKPNIMIAMHGKNIASSMMNLVSMLTHNNNLHFFEIDIIDRFEKTFNDFKEALVRADEGKGIVIFYDMGSIGQMTEMIKNELDIDVALIKVPLTPMLIEASNKAENTSELEVLHQELLKSFNNSVDVFNEVFSRGNLSPVVLVVSKIQNEVAIMIKKYIDDNIDGKKDFSVIPILYHDFEYLNNQITKINKERRILCIIGTKNPEIFGLPYLSLDKLLAIPKENLKYLSLYNTVEVQSKDGLVDKVAELVNDKNFKQNVSDIKQEIVSIVGTFEKEYVLTGTQQLDMALLLGLHYNRIEPYRSKILAGDRDIIAKNKRIYNNVKTTLARFNLGYAFDDGELVRIVEIIKG